MKSKAIVNLGPMLNAYPDSMGGSLSETVALLKKEWKGAFRSIYILPSLYCTDLDRGFSVISYDINGDIARPEDLKDLQDLGIDLKLDFILNHLSVQSPQFRDLTARGEESQYRDFFIDWNAFWEGCGEMTAEGYIQPEEKYIKDMFFRKPGLPILMVRFPDGKRVPYWNTFYQEITKNPDGTERYLGQMDLNIRSELVWDHYRQTLEKLAGYGAAIVRLDAFAYAPKAPGRRNFLNDPETWDLLQKVQDLADEYGLTLLPEIHASYEEGIYRTLAGKGYWVYDFFLPGLLIDALDSGDSGHLAAWANEMLRDDIHTVNMLGCHDGIPLLDLKGLLTEDRIQELIGILKGRGGYVKDLHGAKNMYYQINMTYYSALGARKDAMLLARAIQLFMPGKPQIWYLDLLAGENDYEAVKRAGAGGHKEINRSNLTCAQVAEAMKQDVVTEQLDLLRLRNSHPAFASDAAITVTGDGPLLTMRWETGTDFIQLNADLKNVSFTIDKSE